LVCQNIVRTTIIAKIAELLIVSVSTVARAYIRVHENIDDEMYCSVECFWSFGC